MCRGLLPLLVLTFARFNITTNVVSTFVFFAPCSFTLASQSMSVTGITFFCRLSLLVPIFNQMYTCLKW
jgi:hypothetical protein